MDDAAALPPAPDSWETADLDEPMSRLLLSARRVASSPDLGEDGGDPTVTTAPVQQQPQQTPARVDLGDQLDQFLREALEKPRERLSVLRMEQEILKFIHDPRQMQYEFNGLPTSYLRLAAHRLAQHYFLQSMALPDNSMPDGSGSRIILRKNSPECRLPAVRLADVPVNLPQEESNSVAKVAIKQRPQKHYNNFGSGGANSSRDNLPKSVEERKEEYNKARARIFSNSTGGNASEGRSAEEVTLPNTLHRSTSLELNSSSRLGEGPEITLERSLTTTSSSRSDRSKTEKQPAVNRNRQNSRVAIFRDRESDRKDPDYDRNYDRYMQRFDPGFGFNGASYTIQPLYAPVVNYNTEFPQLGAAHRSPVPVEQQAQSMGQHIPGPWSPSQVPNAMGYRPPDGAMPPPYSSGHAGAPMRSSVFMHTPQQYAMPSRPGVTFVHPQEPVLPFAQTHQQQSEASLRLARPR